MRSRHKTEWRVIKIIMNRTFNRFKIKFKPPFLVFNIIKKITNIQSTLFNQIILILKTKSKIKVKIYYLKLLTLNLNSSKNTYIWTYLNYQQKYWVIKLKKNIDNKEERERMRKKEWTEWLWKRSKNTK